MRNHYNETPLDAARSEVLDWLHALARTLINNHLVLYWQ